MGVSGSGKSTIGNILAEQLNLTFIDADDLHALTNKEKMARGEALTDNDRFEWLNSIAETVSLYEQKGFVLSCSALKEKYRQQIASKLSGPLCIFHLEGDKELIAQRMKNRNHFMPISLLDSQFAILEVTPDMQSVDIRMSTNDIIAYILKTLNIEKG